MGSSAPDGCTRIVELCTGDQIAEAARLLWAVWGAGSGAARNEVVNASLLRALAHSGNYVVGAYLDDRLVGCSVGFFGADGQGPDHLHSHITGVDRSVQGRGVGFALKRHQRAWVLCRGVSTIRWTFDPLARRNAYFNLHKLAARVVGYEPDFYGRLDDGINTGDATDRLVVEWPLRSPRVVRALGGDPPPLGAAPSDPAAATVTVPDDIERLRRSHPHRAREVRAEVRSSLLELLGRGYRIAGLSESGGGYVLLPDAR